MGTRKQRALDELLRELPVVEISSDLVIQQYANLDHASRKLGRRMGKNDLWIAAVTAVLGGVILTTDRDFDHLHPGLVKVVLIDVETLLPGTGISKKG